MQTPSDYLEASFSDIDKIPYDSPLSFQEPSLYWRNMQCCKGAIRSNLSIPAADMTGLRVIITGANSGIGREAAIQMAAWGADLILGCREPPPSEPSPEQVVQECRAAALEAGREKCSVEVWNVDLADLNSVEEFAERWLKTGKALDILCNNAGMGGSLGGSERYLTKDGFEIIHQVNFLSHVLLTLRLLPSLAKAREPRIVCTTSCFHYLGRFNLANCNGDLGDAGMECVKYYQNNKLWFQVWLTELQRRMLRSDEYRHITVNGVHPGWVNSGIWIAQAPGWISYFNSLVCRFLSYFVGINTQQGSLAILNAATSPSAGPNPIIQGVGVPAGKGGGRYFNRIFEEEPMPHSKDPDCCNRVWRKVNDELQLNEKGLLRILKLQYME